MKRDPVRRIERLDYTLLVSGGARGPARSAENVSVEVRLPDGSGWCATLYTPESVRAILDEWRRKDERFGLYFWAPGVVIVRGLTHDGIIALVEDLMAEDELDQAFVRIEEEPNVS
ncbi:MAG: hypothetical protein M3N18_08430 [Actinomycetota bacterium]|nr:hypothetical protein [Actinomycetota bacterium]